jgi:hypothetical protein
MQRKFHISESDRLTHIERIQLLAQTSKEFAHARLTSPKRPATASIKNKAII